MSFKRDEKSKLDPLMSDEVWIYRDKTLFAPSNLVGYHMCRILTQTSSLMWLHPNSDCKSVTPNMPCDPTQPENGTPSHIQAETVVFQLVFSTPSDMPTKHHPFTSSNPSVWVSSFSPDSAWFPGLRFQLGHSFADGMLLMCGNDFLPFLVEILSTRWHLWQFLQCKWTSLNMYD